MAVFPTSLPTNTDPTASNKLASPSHSQLHQSHNAEIVAVETKVGTGASTPTAGKVLRGTGTGTSGWAQVALATDVATATSADLRGILTDETGTGLAVFGTSPSITTPSITSPSITTSINDSAGNEVIKTPATASATNEITVTNAANGNSPSIAATGSSDTNIDLTLIPKGTGTIKTSPVNRIDWTALPLGSVIQVANTLSSASATGTTIIPFDNTIPQITEGVEFMTVTITPKATTNLLIIQLVSLVSYSIVANISGALFQDSTANALATTNVFQPTATGNVQHSIVHTMTAGTTSATTFRYRAGGNSAGTLTFNGAAGTQLFGATTKSSIIITEIKA
jgi:hypothetical protein